MKANREANAKRQASQGRRFITEGQVSEEYGISIKTLQRWRLLGAGPRYRKLGGTAVRYDVNDIELWIAAAPSGGQVIQPPKLMA